jgi:cell surface protein SprA
MSPGLDFAFGFYDDNFVNKALDRGWLLTGDDMTSPAIWNQGEEYNFELNLEPIRGLKIVLTNNLTDNRTRQIQFMYSDMPTSRSGSYTRTAWAFMTALKGSSASDGYASAAFTKFIENIPIIAQRVQAQYIGSKYPTGGFLSDSPLAGTAYNPEIGAVSSTSSDVLIPAFIAAYTGQDASKVNLEHFPGLSSMRPNWRITYDGFINMGNLKNIFKTFTLSHAYQCTYSIGSYTSYLNWVSVNGNLGFTQDELTQQPTPSTPFNISSVAITEKFAPLIGVNVTLQNDININTEYRDSRTLNLNSSAGQIVETTSKQLTIGAGYKIADFSSVIKIGSKQGGVSNDLSLNLDFSLSNNQSLIRKIENAYTQATQGTRTFSINFMASYILSKRVTLSAYFDHQVNTPLVSNSSYPTSNSNYGISINMSLAR